VARNLVNTSKAREMALDWQTEDSNFVARSKGTVIGHRTGAGKTLMTILAWDQWDVGRTLILGTRSSMATWRKLLMYWADTPLIILRGKDDPGWKEYQNQKHTGVWGMTFATFRLFMQSWATPKDLPQPEVVIADELHRILRSRKTVFYDQLLRTHPEAFVGLSATWASRGPQDLWPVLHYCNRKTFSSFWRFVETWCYVENGTFGKEIFGVRNVENLRAMLRQQYYVARPITGFKGIRREIIELDPTPKQQKWIDDLERDMIAEMEGITVIAQNSLVKLLRVRQVCVSPRLLDSTVQEYGAGINYIVEQVSDDPHTVIFTFFAGALPVIRQALIDDGYNPDNIFLLQGGCDEDEIDRVITAWKETRGIVLCTITFAQSFSLDTSPTAYFLGFDWDPNNNLQAEGRLERLDSNREEAVLCRYIVLRGTPEEYVKEIANGKQIDVSKFLLNYKQVKLGVIQL